MVKTFRELNRLADIYDKKKRSEIMSRVRSRGNKATEQHLIGIFRKNGIRGWRRNYPLPGKPDFVFPRIRIAVFVDGCFWHGCPIHGSIPKTNQKFWEKKIARNIVRDREVNEILAAKGWIIIRLWQHDLKDTEKVLQMFNCQACKA